MEFKIESLRQPKDLALLENMLNSRINESTQFNISLENIEHINLANFNALIKLYMKITRTGKGIKFIHCKSDKIRSFINKTQLRHVFCTD